MRHIGLRIGRAKLLAWFLMAACLRKFFDRIYGLLNEFYFLCAKEFLVTEKPEMTHVVLTGRNAKPELIEIADLVTEMTEVKHPFREQGIVAQKGVEF